MWEAGGPIAHAAVRGFQRVVAQVRAPALAIAYGGRFIIRSPRRAHV